MLLMSIIFFSLRNIDKLTFYLKKCSSLTETFKQARCLSSNTCNLKMYFKLLLEGLSRS